MEWEDGFKGEAPEPAKGSAQHLSYLSNILVGALAGHVMKESSAPAFKGIGDEVLSAIVASSLIRLIIGTSLHEFHRMGLFRDTNSEEKLIENSKAFRAVLDHVLGCFGTTLDMIDPRHAHSVNILQKEKSHDQTPL